MPLPMNGSRMRSPDREHISIRLKPSTAKEYRGNLQRFILPVLGPGMVATLLFAFLLAWGDLLWALCLTTSEGMMTVTLGIARTVGEFRIIWPMLMAGSLLGGLPAICLYLFLQRFLVAGLTAGALKE